MPPVHLLIKPASGLCNLRCTYCFYHDITENRETSSYGFMSDDTLEQLVKKSLDYADQRVTFAFQGGEPTLIGLPFYERLTDLVSTYKKGLKKALTVHFALQTNGMNLNEDWARFFHKHRFLLGLSLDGYKETNDRYRLDPKGNGTFATIMNAAKLLGQFQVEYNILTVVNASTAKRIEKIYHFYKKSGFKYLQFIPCLEPLFQEPFQEAYSLTPKTYEYFLKTLFDLWYRDVKSGEFIYIRQFENYIGMLLGYPPESCGMSGVCSMQNVIESDGGVYPCDFYVLDAYRLGNLNTDGFEEINARRKALGFIEQSTHFHPKCSACKHVELCRGGCRRDREAFLPEKGHFSLNRFCSSFEGFFEYSRARMFEICEDVLKRRN